MATSASPRLRTRMGSERDAGEQNVLGGGAPGLPGAPPPPAHPRPPGYGPGPDEPDGPGLVSSTPLPAGQHWASPATITPGAPGYGAPRYTPSRRAGPPWGFIVTLVLALAVIAGAFLYVR